MSVKIFLYSLGCAKNQVDAEMMSGLLTEAGFVMVDNAVEAEVIIINTCGFLTSSKQEAIHAIIEYAEYKSSGKCRLLLTTGCMPQKYAAEMTESLPEIDGMLGSRQYTEIVRLIKDKLALDDSSAACPANPYMLRRLSTPPYMAYLKIADGCDNCCAYCLIPQLRGKFYSRPMEDLLEEARLLYGRGVQELVLIAQDTTAYGKDLYGEIKLPELLAQIAEIGFHWVRLMYCYPTRIEKKLLETMVKYDNICHYLDLPMQHADDEILHAMHRSDTNRLLREKLELIRSYMPDCAIRTTMMVGFPGERVEHWHNLLDFLRDERLSWVGVFAFSREEDTLAYNLPHQVKPATKERRRSITVDTIAKITTDVLKSYVGQKLEILVEGVDENGIYFGRSSYHANEVDGQVLFTSEQELYAGQFVEVRIIGVNELDLIGEFYESGK